MEDDLVKEAQNSDEKRRQEAARAKLQARLAQPLDPLDVGRLAPGATEMVSTGAINRAPGARKMTDATIGDVAGDVGKGFFIEGPTQVIGGITDAARETLKFANEVDLFIADAVGYSPALNLKDPLKSGLIVNKADHREGLEVGVPEVRDPTTMTGGLIRGTSQFAAGFYTGSKATQGIQVTSRAGRLVKATMLGATVDFVAFDPYEARFSDLLADLPTGAARPFFEWMATEDSALEGRAKNAIEGSVMGLAADGVMALGGAFVRHRQARIKALEAEESLRLKNQEQGLAEATRLEAEEANLPDKLREMLGEEQDPQKALDTIRKFLGQEEVPARQIDEGADFQRPKADGEQVDVAAEANTVQPDVLTDAQKVLTDAQKIAGEKPNDITEKVDGLIGPIQPADVTRPRTKTELAVDEIEALPAMEARAKAEELTGQKPRSKADAIELVRKSVGGEEKPYINTRMINGPEELETAIRNLADGYRAELDQGVRTTEAVIADAKDIKNFDELSRKRPERLTDAEQYALREMWASSTRQVRDLAEQAAISTDPVVQFAFRRSVTMHRSIQAYAFEARAAAARQLRQWAIPVGENADMLRGMEDTINSFGGSDVGQKLAKKMSEAFAAGNTLGVENMIKRGWGIKTWDMLSEFGLSMKLYQPSTHLVNMGGNGLLVPWEMLNRKVAEGVGAISQTGVKQGEAAAMGRGIMLGFRDAFIEARMALRTGNSYAGASKVEVPRQSAFDPARLEMKEGTLAAKGMKVIATAVQAPFRALNAGDVFFKVMNERGEVYAQAMRAAVREGADDLEKAKELFAQYVNEPTRSMQEAAIRSAQEMTFTRPVDGFAKSLMGIRNIMGPFGYTVFAFVQTPANILSYGLRSSPAAPIMRRFREDWAEGGAARDVAIARMATGTTMLSLAYDMAMNGEITGGGPPPGHPARAAWLRENQPYSVKIGDTHYQYSRADPFGLWFGTSSDLYETFALVDWDKDVAKEADEIFAAVGFSLGGTMMDKTWMTGAADIMEALSQPDMKGETYIQGVLTGYLPSGLKTAARVNDPYLREIENIPQAFKAHFGLSEGFPLRRDWLGRPIDRSSGMGAVYDFMSPIRVKQDSSEPIDQEILRLGWGPSKPQKRITYQGTSIGLRNRLDLYSRYLELSGQTKIGGKTLNDALNEIVSGKGDIGRKYQELSDGPEGQKRQVLESVVAKYRQAARVKLIMENKDWFDEQAEIRIDRRDTQAQEQRQASAPSFTLTPE